MREIDAMHAPDSLPQAAGARATARPGVARGLTLVELLIALSIGMIVISMTLSGLNSMNTLLDRDYHRSLVNDEARRLNEFLAARLRGVGGGALQPHHALWVDNGFGAAGSDRLTSVRLLDHTLQCVIKQVKDHEVQVQKEQSDCCLKAAFVGREVVLTSGGDDGATWASRRVTSVNENGCKAALEPGRATALDLPPADETAWTDGTIAAVGVQVFWLDEARDLLMVEEDYDQDGTYETRVVADQVLDLQVALGYDVSPWDWRIHDTVGNDDEWLFNAFGDTFGQRDGQGLASARRHDLRMVRFGILVGHPMKGFNTRAGRRLLDGPERNRPGWVLGAFTSTVALRNYDIMR